MRTYYDDMAICGRCGGSGQAEWVREYDGAIMECEDCYGTGQVPPISPDSPSEPRSPETLPQVPDPGKDGSEGP